MNSLQTPYSYPSEIRFTEKYHCEIEKSNIPRDEWKKDRLPEGKIEIIVPYNTWSELRKANGARSLLRKNRLLRLQETFLGVASTLSKVYLWKYNDDSSTVGDELEVQNYDFTDLDSRLYLNSSDNKLPLRDILTQAVQEWTSDDLFDTHDRQITLKYTPDIPRILPLEIEIKVFDENEVKDKRDTRHLSMSRSHNSKLTKEVARQIREQTGFESSLILEFRLSLKLQDAREIMPEQLPRVNRMALKWPAFVSPHHIQLSVVYKIENEEKDEAEDFVNIDYPAVYDPEKSVITWTNVPFGWDEIDEDKRVYKTWWMRLEIHDSMELYRRKARFEKVELLGEIDIEIPTLLSGIKVNNPSWLKPEIKTHTKLLSDLQLNLEEQFDRKVFSPYQHLQFPNVLLDEMRIADINMLLQDMRFRVDEEEPIADEGVVKKILITAERQEGTGKLKLWVLAEGEKYGTTREKEIPGNEKFRTRLPSGRTNIYIRGQLRGDTYRVVQVINEIHDHLKERFRHVNTVE